MKCVGVLYFIHKPGDLILMLACRAWLCDQHWEGGDRQPWTCRPAESVISPNWWAPGQCDRKKWKVFLRWWEVFLLWLPHALFLSLSLSVSLSPPSFTLSLLLPPSPLPPLSQKYLEVLIFKCCKSIIYEQLWKGNGYVHYTCSYHRKRVGQIP